jgi:hypothetical protein
MALLNFPQNPQVGDIYSPPNSTKTYRWNGSAWLVVTSSNTATDFTAKTLYLTTTTNSSIYDPTLGALVVEGGVYIKRDLVINGFLYLNESPVITTSSFNAQAADGVDIDIVLVTGTNQLIFNNISTLQTVTGRGNSTTNIVRFLDPTESTSTDTGGVVVVGGLGVGKRINSESIQIADTVFDSTKTTVNTTGQYLVDTYSLNDYRSSKYFIQIDEGTTSTARFQSLEIMLLATNTGTAKATEYGMIASDGELGTFSKDVTNVGGEWMVNLYFTPNDSVEKTIKVLRTAMTV